MTNYCDIIVPVWNQLRVTRPCLESVVMHTRVPFRFILVDNGSGPDTRDFLADFRDRHAAKTVLIRNDENLGFVPAINQGMARCRNGYVCLLNNDTLVTPGWLSNMMTIMEQNPVIGVLNPTWQGAEGRTPEERMQRLQVHRGEFIETAECMGFCFLIRPEVIRTVGHMDPVYGMGGLDDSDYSRQAVLAGYVCARAKDTYVFHWENTSLNVLKNWRRDRQKKTEIYLQKWGQSKRLAVVRCAGSLSDSSLRDEIMGLLDLARVGVHVHLWLVCEGGRSSATVPADWPRHNYLKVRRISFGAGLPGRRQLQSLAVSVLLASRNMKKDVHRFTAAVIADPFLYDEVQRWRCLHRVSVFPSLEACAVVEREMQWARESAERRHNIIATSM